MRDLEDYTLPYSTPMQVTTGSLLLSIPLAYRHPLISGPDNRLYVPPGVATIMFTWDSPERAVSNLRYMRLDASLNLVSGGSWQQVPTIPPAVGGVPSMMTMQLSSEHGAVFLANIQGTPSAQEVANRVSLGVLVIPSMSGV